MYSKRQEASDCSAEAKRVLFFTEEAKKSRRGHHDQGGVAARVTQARRRAAVKSTNHQWRSCQLFYQRQAVELGTRSGWSGPPLGML